MLWPTLLVASHIQLLGLFRDEENATNTTELSVHAAVMFHAAIVIAQRSNMTINGTVISWRQEQTGGKVIEALSEACRASSKTSIVGIVGPELSREAHLITASAGKTGITVISYAATDPGLSDRNAHPAFHRTVPSNAAAALAIAHLFRRFDWTSCLLIYQNDAFGTGGAEAIGQAFLKHDLVQLEWSSCGRNRSIHLYLYMKL